MNKFFTDNFNISHISACVFVKGGTGQPNHRNRKYHGLVIQINGRKKYVFDTGAEFVINEGDVFYLPKFSNYDVLNVEGGDCIAVNFDLCDRALTYEQFIQRSPHSHNLKKYFEELLNYWTLQKNGYMNASMASLYKIIYNLQSNAAVLYTPSSSRKYVDKAVEYIHANISDSGLTVQSVSETLNISTEYLRRLFIKVYKFSPKQYIIDARMRRAKELLLSNEFTVSRVAQLCGYDNESYFSSEFKRMFDYSPSYCRKKEL